MNQPAFPCPTPHSDQGMTLRDYLAAASMPVIGYRMEMLNANWTPKHIAYAAYQIADAMIEVREYRAFANCEHGSVEGEYCEACNRAYKEAAADPDNGSGDDN